MIALTVGIPSAYTNLCRVFARGVKGGGILILLLQKKEDDDDNNNNNNNRIIE